MYKHVIDGVETRFVRDGYQIVQERNSANEITRSYVWDPTAPGGIGGLLEMTSSTTCYAYIYNGRGNVSALTDESGNIVCEYRYEPFGGIIVRTLAAWFIEHPYRFSMKHRYTSTGISNYGIVDYGTL